MSSTVLFIPVHQPARVETIRNFYDLQTLLGVDTFDTVLLQRDGRYELSLVVDDEGMVREPPATPHLWARGSVIHGPAAVVQHNHVTGEQVNITEEYLRALNDALEAKVLADLFWPLVAFARIPPGREAEALVEAEKLRAAHAQRLREQGREVLELGPRRKE